MSQVTLVTAVNLPYLHKLERNFPTWVKTEGLNTMPLKVFVTADILQDVKEYDRLIKILNQWKTSYDTHAWSFPAAEGNVREIMLSAFVFGVAREVTTTQWMKLDADTESVTSHFDIPALFPDHSEYAVIAHRWNYTKMKGDSNISRHWLNRLDDWWEGLSKDDSNTRLFPEYDPVKDRRVSHPRVCSFAQIESTFLTQMIAEASGNRLPIPSQDTTVWYVATRMGLDILRTNMKRYFRP